MDLKKNFIVSLLLSQILFAWSGDKLSDGSCKFDMDTGYSYTNIYVNNQLESYVIIGVNDPRYGLNEYVYNGNNCELISSGDARKSSYKTVLRNNNFEKIISSKKGKVEKIDKWLKAITIFSTDSREDAIYIHIQPNDESLISEINSIIESITTNTSFPLIHESSDMISKFKYHFIKVINNTELSSINYHNFFTLIQKIPNLTDLKYHLSKKIDRYIINNLSVSDIPSFERNILREYSQYSDSYLNSYPKINDFGKINFDNFQNSIEYQYFFKRIGFDIKIDTEKPFFYIVSKKPSAKVKLFAIKYKNDIVCTEKVNTYNRELGVMEQLFTLGLSHTATVTEHQHICKLQNEYKYRMKNLITKLNPSNLSNILKKIDNLKSWKRISKSSENWHVWDNIMSGDPEKTENHINCKKENDSTYETCKSNCIIKFGKKSGTFIPTKYDRCTDKCYYKYAERNRKCGNYLD